MYVQAVNEECGLDCDVGLQLSSQRDQRSSHPFPLLQQKKSPHTVLLSCECMHNAEGLWEHKA